MQKKINKLFFFISLQFFLKMSRSKWKLAFFTKEIWRKKFKLNFLNNNIKKRFVYSRSSHIPLSFIYKVIKIHKGKNFNFFFVDIYNVGFKFGEFSFTKKFFHYPLKKKKK